MKKNSKGFAQVLIILLLVTVGVLIYFGLKYAELSKQTERLDRLHTSPSPSASSSPTAGWETYTNTKYNYSIQYPSDWTYREFPDTQSGAAFRLVGDPNNLNHEHVTIDFNSRAGDLVGIPFEEYVKKGAIDEIQNYVSLASIEKVVTETSLVGYKTTWNIQVMGETLGKTSVSAPITYFDTKDGVGDTIQVSESDNSYSDIYNQMLSTFKFTR